MLTYLKQLSLSFPTVLYIAPILTFTREWISNYILFDTVMIVNMFIIILIDTLLGFAVAYKLHTISSNSFSRVFTKIIVYMVLLISVHITTHFTSTTATNSMVLWLDSVMYSAIFIRELLSIFEKTSKLGIFTVPTSILKRLNDFNDDGKSK